MFSMYPGRDDTSTFENSGQNRIFLFSVFCYLGVSNGTSENQPILEPFALANLVSKDMFVSASI